MDNATENLIKYFMTICAAGAVLWKALDSWEKRKTAAIGKIEARLDKCEEKSVKCDETYKELHTDMMYNRGAIDKINERFDKVNDSFRDWLKR